MVLVPFLLSTPALADCPTATPEALKEQIRLGLQVALGVTVYSGRAGR